MKSFIYLPQIAIFFGLFFWGWHLKIKDLINAHKANKIFEKKLQFLNRRIMSLGTKRL